MTTQTSPFEIDNNNSSSAPAVSSDEFSIHTMKDDLELMKKGEFVLSEKTSAPMQKSAPMQSSSAPIAAEPKTETTPAPVDYSKNPSPFFAGQPAPEKKLPSNISPSPAPYKLEDPFQETKKVETFSQKQPLQNPSMPTPAVATDTQTGPFEKKEVPIVEIPAMESSVASTNGTAYKIIIVVIFVLIVAILALGGYYFWITKTPPAEVEPTPVEEVIAEETPVVEESPVIIEQPTEKYSSSKPNYLVLDIANLGAEEIKTVLISTASEIKEKAPSSIYEFAVVNKNNNPVTFAIFAVATKMNLSQNVLSALDKDFSLFIYNDNGNVRMGLAVSAKNKDVLSKELLLQEKTLATDISPVFLDIKPEIQAGWTFKNGSYGAYKTRYLNLNATGSLSIDYTITENKLVIGTSMQTMRSIVEKSKAAASTQETVTQKDTELMPATNSASQEATATAAN